PATSSTCTLSLHDALPILSLRDIEQVGSNNRTESGLSRDQVLLVIKQGLQLDPGLLQHLERCSMALNNIEAKGKEALAESDAPEDRKSTRLNSSHVAISYA